MNKPFAQQMQEAQQLRHKIFAEGLPALRRVLQVAMRDTGQAGTCARFLLGLYNDRRFPFALTDLRSLDDDLFNDCMAVLRMDAHVCEREVHCYFEDGGEIWEQLAEDWRVRDHTIAYRP
ncbi:DUF7673 family protein [Vogesella oryzae]|uniref:DUF7673 family protein n=1 Tax=Vogesella oryzae TaxID=1735285 RepID=UPI001C2E509F|nr:hypothetical protein [Vogesella oryzae]